MTFLLLQVSGVTLMEDKIDERRPGYADYKERVSAFIPWPSKDCWPARRRHSPPWR